MLTFENIAWLIAIWHFGAWLRTAFHHAIERSRPDPLASALQLFERWIAQQVPPPPPFGPVAPLEPVDDFVNRFMRERDREAVERGEAVDAGDGVLHMATIRPPAPTPAGLPFLTLEQRR